MILHAIAAVKPDLCYNWMTERRPTLEEKLRTDNLGPDAILASLTRHRDTLYQKGVRRIGLFGSFVRGEARPESDIDLLVTLARPSFGDYVDILFFLEGLFGRNVDLVMDTALKPRLRPYVMKEVRYAAGL